MKNTFWLQDRSFGCSVVVFFHLHLPRKVSYSIPISPTLAPATTFREEEKREEEEEEKKKKKKREFGSTSVKTFLAFNSTLSRARGRRGPHIARAAGYTIATQTGQNEVASARTYDRVAMATLPSPAEG